MFVGLLLLGGSLPAAAQGPAVAGDSCADSTATPAGSSTGLVSDCATLLAARDALRGTATLNWSRDLGIREWDGITVDIGVSSVRVTRLELPGKGLSGVIPPGLGDLAGLERLDLSGNGLTGSLPASLSKLSGLRALRLQDNQLTGGIPAEYASLNLANVESAPTLGFTQTEYFLHPRAFIWYDDTPRKRQLEFATALPTMPVALFDQVVVEAGSETASDVKYAVEGLPDKSLHQFCGPVPTVRKCIDLGIGVGEKTGYLFAKVDEPCKTCGAHYTNDYPTQRMELSVSGKEDASGLKVYREVLVNRPDSAPDCSDFPHKDVDRYTCLFLHEMLPAELPATTAALRDGLPNLVQPKANYDLIFAEEFNGNLGQELPTDRCHNGLATLDRDLWSHHDRCPEANPDTQEACHNIEDGYFYMARTAICRGQMDTEGFFEYKYGYLEVKYRVNFKNGNQGFSNHALVVGNAGSPGRIEVQNYKVPMNGYEDLSKYIETELDIFEWNPADQSDVSGQYRNWFRTVKSRDAAPAYSQKAYYFCKEPTDPRPHAIKFMDSAFCAQSHVTLTKGFEWTPRGYRFFLKVDGAHDDFITISKEDTRIQVARVSGSGDNVRYGNVRTVSASTRDAFFEFLNPTDPGSILEQLDISHRPLALFLSSHGGPPSNRDIRTKVEVDYIRVYQPKDRYMGMEPVYK